MDGLSWDTAEGTPTRTFNQYNKVITAQVKYKVPCLDACDLLGSVPCFGVI
jgi:hypothetical protein